MKYLSPIIILFVIFTSVACNSGTDSKSKKETEEHVVITKEYALDSEQSLISWIRTVDYKYISKQVFIFGAYVDVTMENVQYETNGEIIPTGGVLNTEDDVLSSGKINIDLSLTRFYSDEEEQFFVADEYPPAYIELIEITLDSLDSYNVMADFVMEDKSISIDFPATITKSEDSFYFSAEIILEASKLPILNQPDPENVNLDEIKFDLNIFYSLDH